MEGNIDAVDQDDLFVFEHIAFWSRMTAFCPRRYHEPGRSRSTKSPPYHFKQQMSSLACSLLQYSCFSFRLSFQELTDNNLHVDSAFVKGRTDFSLDDSNRATHLPLPVWQSTHQIHETTLPHQYIDHE